MNQNHLFRTVMVCGVLLTGTAPLFAEGETATPAAAPAVKPAEVADKDLGFTGKTDKNPVLYKAGEPMKFTFELIERATGKPVAGRTVRYIRSGDDGKTENGTFVSGKPFLYTTKIDQPGFVRIRLFVQDANGKDVKARYTIFDGGAGADVNAIPAYPAPEDFRAFWGTEMKKLLDTPYKVKLEELKLEKFPQIAAFKYSVTTFDGERPATGFICYPKDAVPGSLPMLVKFNGYGFHRTNLVHSATQAKKTLVVDVTRHGEDPDRNDKEYYTELKNGPMKSFCFRNNDDLRNNDFYKMILRGQRAIQYAMTLPQWDRKTIRTNGGSMGGYQAIAAAALNPKVTQCNAFIPWCADLAGGAKYRRMTGWRPGWTETLGYFDLINLAVLVKCPVTMGIGLGDYICPPSGQMLLFRQLGGQKTMNVSQNHGHGGFLGPKSAPYTFRQEIR